MAFPFFAKKRTTNIYTIAFYNLENLFDTQDDPSKLDDDFTPTGFKKWTPKRYRKKIGKLSRTLSHLGVKESHRHPVLIGLAELENKKVIGDLLSASALKDISYQFVHYDSPDERGIDTALLYDPKYFQLLSSSNIPLLVNNLDGMRDATRDILYVHGKLNEEEIHLFVNHWPSRRDGDTETAYKRIKAAETIHMLMSEIEVKTDRPNFVIMGDFNDGPTDTSIQTLVRGKPLYNPMEVLITAQRGSANYKQRWSLFDQILFSKTFFNNEAGTHSFAHANIFDDRFLQEWKGQYKGNPFRTYVGRKYLGGYSDHFPVYIQLQLESTST
jgi:predicted extracellular nuclease